MEGVVNTNPNWNICSVWLVNSVLREKIFQGSLIEARKYVDNYIKYTLKFNSHYTRVWIDDKDRMWNDYGSYINFIVFVEGDSDVWETNNCNGCLV